MRIGIDATCWANGRGYGRYTRELVTALAPLASAHELICLLDERAREQFDLRAPHVSPLVVNQKVSPTIAASQGHSRSPMDMLRLTQAVRRARFDVFYSPSVYGYFPLPPGLAAAVTIHDAIAEQFPQLTLPTVKDRLLWRMKVRLAIAQARLILTVSDYAADEIARHLGVARSGMRVTLEGVSDAYFPSDDAAEIRNVATRVGLPPHARWLTYVGGFGPHKRLDVVIRAHAAVARRHADQPLYLLLAGPHEDGFYSDTAALRAAIDASGTTSLVIWTGRLSDADLRHLHSGAVALVLASAAEGFGLPAVEAARCGTPVIATTSSPLPQILEGGGLFVAQGDEAALAAAIERLLTDEPARQRMGRMALERARQLSWSHSARVVLDALEDLAGPARRSRSRDLAAP